MLWNNQYWSDIIRLGTLDSVQCTGYLSRNNVWGQEDQCPGIRNKTTKLKLTGKPQIHEGVFLPDLPTFGSFTSTPLPVLLPLVPSTATTSLTDSSSTPRWQTPPLKRGRWVQRGEERRGSQRETEFRGWECSRIIILDAFPPCGRCCGIGNRSGKTQRQTVGCKIKVLHKVPVWFVIIGERQAKIKGRGELNSNVRTRPGHSVSGSCLKNTNSSHAGHDHRVNEDTEVGQESQIKKSYGHKVKG